MGGKKERKKSTKFLKIKKNNAREMSLFSPAQ